jgi:hypothetical protein
VTVDFTPDGANGVAELNCQLGIGLFARNVFNPYFICGWLKAPAKLTTARVALITLLTVPKSVFCDNFTLAVKAFFLFITFDLIQIYHYQLFIQLLPSKMSIKPKVMPSGFCINFF